MSRLIAIHQSPGTLKVPPAAITRLFQTLDSWTERAIPGGELSLALLRAEELAAVHQQFLDDPSETDVITFPGDPDSAEPFAGEICVSVDRAAEGPLPFPEELTLYLVHGWLHLSGLGDKTPEESALMRSAEQSAMTWLQDHNATIPHP